MIRTSPRPFSITAVILLVLAQATGAQEIRDVDTLKAESARSYRLLQEGKAAEALPIAQRVASAAEKMFGASSPNTAYTLIDLGLIYQALGQYTKTEALYQRSLKIYEDSRGKDSTAVAATCQNLGSIYQDLGEYTKAEAYYTRGRRIWEDKLGKDHPNIATSLSSLGLLYDRMGQHAKAEPLLLRSLQIREDKQGQNHPDTATSLNNLALVYDHMGQYAKAEPLYRRSLQIREEQLGKDHPSVATASYNIASLYKSMAEYAKAETFYVRSLRIREAKLGKDHPEVANSLNGLAILFDVQGQYQKAEPLFRRSLDIRERAFGKDHPEVANGLINMAAMYQTLNQYAKAEPLFQRSLQIYEARLGKDHPFVGHSLDSLGLLYQNMDQYAKAEPLHLRALQIYETKLGKNHPEVALCLHNLGLLYQSQGNYAKAEQYATRSLRIREDLLGKDHPSVATSLYNLAWIYRYTGQPAKAEPLFQRSLRIWETKLGKDHPTVAQSLDNLAMLREAANDTAQAADLIERSRRIVRGHVARVLPALSEAEQDSFLRGSDVLAWHRALSLGLYHPGEQKLAERSAAWLINGKGVTQEALAQAALLARDARDPTLSKLSQQLLQVRQELAHLTLAPATDAQAGQRQRRLDLLSQAEQDLAKQLRQASGVGEESWVELAQVRKGLPADAVLINLARFEVFNFRPQTSQKWRGPAHYVAWIIPAEGPVRILDLGESKVIDAEVEKAQQFMKNAPKTIRLKGEADAEKEVREPLEALARKVLHPLLPHITKTKRWIISPDGSLWHTPWSALPLPDGKYAVEDHILSYAISGRDLVERSPAKVTPTAPMVLADPDFDLGLDELAMVNRRLQRQQEAPAETRGLSRALRLVNIPRLPATATEAAAITAPLHRYAGVAPRVYTGKEATEGIFLAARNPRVVVLSTHGYFLPDEEADAKERDRLDRLDPAPRRLRLENPLLRCGLLLAGCNNAAKAKQGADNGVLTGLQIAGTDLRGCQLVVLSACETGLGEVRNGQGVAGLRQAFQLAGAQSVVATLWQVPDQQTAQLMIGFFNHLAQQPEKAEALRQAQVTLIKARRDRTAAAHPYFWAAFTLTGR